MNFANFLIYEPATGRLLWAVDRPGRFARKGTEAGSVKHDGRYRSFVLEGKRHYCHRVAWVIARGAIPVGMCIDHIDGDGLNNRLSNLRLTTRSGNQRNKRLAKNNRTGYSGVFKTRSGFSVQAAGRYIGHFMDLDKAIEAREQASQQLGFHPNHGRKTA